MTVKRRTRTAASLFLALLVLEVILVEFCARTVEAKISKIKLKRKIKKLKEILPIIMMMKNKKILPLPVPLPLPIPVIFDIMKKTPDLNQIKKQVMQLLMSKMNMMDKGNGNDYGNNMNNYGGMDMGGGGYGNMQMTPMDMDKYNMMTMMMMKDYGGQMMDMEDFQREMENNGYGGGGSRNRKQRDNQEDGYGNGYGGQTKGSNRNQMNGGFNGNMGRGGGYD